MRRKLDEDKALECLRSTLLELGISSSTYYLYKYTGYCPCADYFINHYGSWQGTLSVLIERYPKFTNELEEEKLKRKILTKKRPTTLLNYTDAELHKLLKLVLTKDNNTRNYYDTHKSVTMPTSLQIIKRLGNWHNIMLKIGYRDNSDKGYIKRELFFKNHTDTELLEMVSKTLKNSKLKTKTQYDLTKEKEMFSSFLICKRFGGWSNVLKKIGEEPNKHQRTSKYAKLTDTEFLTLITDELQRLGVTLLSDYVKMRDKQKTPTYRNILSRGYNWSYIINNSGLKFNYELLTDDELLELIEENVLDNAKCSVDIYHNNNYKPSYNYLTKRLGSWGVIIKKLRVNRKIPTNPYSKDYKCTWAHYSKSELYAIIRSFVLENGIRTATDYNKLSKGNKSVPSNTTVIKRFGNLTDVIYDREWLNLED